MMSEELEPAASASMDDASVLKTPIEEGVTSPEASNNSSSGGDVEANGIASNGNHETDLNGHSEQRATSKEKEPRVEPLVLKRSVLQQKQRWSCKEELAFYRTLVSVGIEMSQDASKTILWEEFRTASKLDKSDDILNEYFHAFIAMCKRTVGMPGAESDDLHQVHIEAISKEKALNVLKKIQQIPEDMRPESWRIAQKPEPATAGAREMEIKPKSADKDSKSSSDSEKSKSDLPEKTVPPLRINLLSLQKRTNGVEADASRSKKDDSDPSTEQQQRNLESEVSDSGKELLAEDDDEKVELENDDVANEDDDDDIAKPQSDEEIGENGDKVENGATTTTAAAAAVDLDNRILDDDDDSSKKSGDRATPSALSTTSSEPDLTTATSTTSKTAENEKVGMQKRKLSDDSKEDKTKKKKRLDDIMLGLGASKGVDLDNPKTESSKKDHKSSSTAGDKSESKSSKVPELNKLKELLCRTDLMPEPRKERSDSSNPGNGRDVFREMNEKLAQSFGLDMKSLHGMGNISDKMFQDFSVPKAKPMTSQENEAKAKALDEATMMKAFGLDPKVLQSMGITLEQLMKLDPNLMQFFNNGPKHTGSPLPSPTAAPKKPPPPPPPPPPPQVDKNRLQQDMMAMMGLDPKKMDPAMLSAIGMNMNNIDMWTMAALGMDPKSLGGSFGGMDPALLNAMYSQQFSNLGNFGKMSPNRSHSPASSKTSRATPSPKQAPNTKSDNYRPSSRSSAPSPKSMDPRSSFSSLYGDLSMTGMPGVSSKSHSEMKSSLSDQKLMSALSRPQNDSKMGSSSLKGASAIDQLQAMLSLPGVDPRALAIADPKLFEAAGLDPKLFNRGFEKPKEPQPPKLTQGFDPKMMKGLDPKLFDPKLMQGMDPKLFAGLDAKLLQGFDHNLLAAMNSKPQMHGFDPKLMGGLDPKLFAGLDPKLLAGFDPKMMAGLDPKLMQGMMGFDPSFYGMNQKFFGGIDPKFLAGMDPKMLAAMEPMLSAASFSPKASSTASSQGSNAPDPRLNGLDPKLLQGLDAKTLQSLGLDPNLVANILNPKSSSLPPRSSPSSFSQNYPRLTPSKPSATATSTLTNSQSKTSSAASLLGLDPKLAAAYGIDLNLLAGLDPKFLQGLDPKLLGFDPMLLAGKPKPDLAHSPKPSASFDGNPFGAKEHNFYEMNSRSLSSPSAMSPKSSPSRLPQAKGSPMDLKSNSGPEMKKKSAFDQKMSAGLDPFFMAGLDQKFLAGLDPKLLAGFDPKQMAALDPKFMAGLDPKLLSGLDPKLMAGLDPKLLAGLDPKLMAGFDAKFMSGLDPKLLAGLDPKLMAGFDPKMFAGIDPKLMMAGLDPKLLSGFDPKLMASLSGFNQLPGNKNPSEQETSKSSKIPPGMDPSMAAMFGGWGMPPSGLGSSSTLSRPKPGTVAAALEEKKSRASMDFASFMMGGSGKEGSGQLDSSFLSKFDAGPAMNLSKRKPEDDIAENLTKSRLDDHHTGNDKN